MDGVDNFATRVSSGPAAGGSGHPSERCAMWGARGVPGVFPGPSRVVHERAGLSTVYPSDNVEITMLTLSENAASDPILSPTRSHA